MVDSRKSVIISCAGLGSRLGLATTKALIQIDGISLIGLQLELLKEVEDIRIVVGFQANDVIEEVKRFRKDAIFVYNHDYFNTKTGASYYLGARNGYTYALGFDGDLLVHPDDLQKLLNIEGEWIAYANRSSDDAIMCKVNAAGDVLSFPGREGDYEWTGPCCIHKEKLRYSSGHVYNLLEPYLPMKGILVRACDIDTYDDYQRAIQFVKSW